MMLHLCAEDFPVLLINIYNEVKKTILRKLFNFSISRSYLYWLNQTKDYGNLIICNDTNLTEHSYFQIGKDYNLKKVVIVALLHSTHNVIIH